jgi:hypothetical protein
MGYRPVINAERDGWHTETVTWARVRRSPSEANLSM